MASAKTATIEYDHAEKCWWVGIACPECGEYHELLAQTAYQADELAYLFERAPYCLECTDGPNEDIESEAA